MNARSRLLSFALLLIAAPLFSAGLEPIPATFDFGWSPENAKISCDFLVKNKTSDAIGLQALKPACGCTAAKFSPMSLASDDDTKIGLTFNTRGYKGITFSKSAELTTKDNSDNITVYLRGFVENPNAVVSPKGNGIAAFEPSKKKSSEKITLQNKSDKKLSLHIIQPPASWAKVKLGDDTINPNGTVDVSISVSGSLEEARNTSVTIEASLDDERHRVTLAIRTGTESAYQPIRPGQSSVNPARQNSGPSDPLKLKPIEPVRTKK